MALQTLQVEIESESGGMSYLFLGGKQANSAMFPKEVRPLYLQDDAYFDTFKPEVALQAVMAWGQTMAMQQSNLLKERKAEKSTNLKTNTAVKMVEVKAGVDDATTKFHPQRFLRPPVVAPEKYWNLFPKKWDEKYYSVYLEDVGLQNDLGQRQIELLHDRRSSIKIKMFAPANVNVGRGGAKTTNVRSCEDGNSLDLVSKDEWTKLANLTDLELALDNLVAAYACFWPGDRSMVTLRRVVTKTKSFKAVANQETRMKLLEVFINQILEVNQRKATQDEVPMNFKEVMEVAKDKLENVSDYFRSESGAAEVKAGEVEEKSGGSSEAKTNARGGYRRKPDQQEFIKRILKEQKIHGKEFCINYNIKGEDGGTLCSSRNCKKAHNCAFVPKGETKACGRRHSKIEHYDATN